MSCRSMDLLVASQRRPDHLTGRANYLDGQIATGNFCISSELNTRNIYIYLTILLLEFLVRKHVAVDLFRFAFDNGV